MSKVITLGEIMIRLSPDGNKRFFQEDTFHATFGGSEANVAISLAKFGIETAFVSKLPEGVIGQAAIDKLRSFGVETRFITRGGARMGVYYLEKGTSLRKSICIYDREHSSMSEALTRDFDWESIFCNAEWFHFSGITPALGTDSLNIVERACVIAKNKGIKISLDINYRKKLWTLDEAKRAFLSIFQYVDLCIVNEEDIQGIFGVGLGSSNVIRGEIDVEQYMLAIKQITKEFCFKKVAVTIRKSKSATENDWSGIFYDGSDFYFSEEYNINIVDRVGAGDSFAAGLIYSLLCQKTNQETIDFAVAASALKHTFEGDFNLASLPEVESLISGDISGRIER